jgi:hypothetical protein
MSRMSPMPPMPRADVGSCRDHLCRFYSVSWQFFQGMAGQIPRRQSRPISANVPKSPGSPEVARKLPREMRADAGRCRPMWPFSRLLTFIDRLADNCHKTSTKFAPLVAISACPPEIPLPERSQVGVAPGDCAIFAAHWGATKRQDLWRYCGEVGL